MSKQIKFNDLINKSDFESGVNDVVGFIKLITAEIDKTKTSANQLTTILGKNLKDDIAALSSASSKLATDMSNITKKMVDFKTTAAQTEKVIGDYEKEVERLNKELTELKAKQDQASKSAQGVGRSAKTASVNMAGMAQSLVGVASGAALVYSGIRVLKEQLIEAIKSTIEFEQAMKEVQAISRATSADLALLTENANRLGATTEKTAGDIARLQKELGKLGFNTTDILASTDAIVDLATATGEGLPESATVAAATLRAFGLEAVEMTRVVDVMAGSFVRSGLDLDKFRESMKLVAPIAGAANINVETVTAALSKLADAGLSGSLAGTALRNLLSNMADPTSKLAKYLGYTVESSEQLVDAFKDLRDRGVDLADAVQMVDVRARPAFFTLMNQADAVENLALEYKLLSGEANDIAETMRDTLANDIAIADSAFDAMRRNLAEKLTPSLRTGAQNLATFSEALRFLTNDVSEFIENNDKAVNVFWETIKIAAVMPKLIEQSFDKMKVSNSFKLMDESVNSTKLSLEGLNEQLENTVNIQEELSSVKLFDDSITKEGALELLNLYKALPEQADILKEKLTSGIAQPHEALKAYQSALQTSLKSLNSSVTQQENKLVMLQKDYAQFVKKNGDDIKAGTVLFNERSAILQNIKAVQAFLKDNASNRVILEGYIRDIQIQQVDLSEDDLDLDDKKKKKLDERLKLEREISKITLETELQQLEFDAKNEANLVKKQALEDAVYAKKYEIILENYNKELEVIEELYKEDVNYLLKREVAYKNFYKEISKLGLEFQQDDIKSKEEAEKLLDKAIETARKEAHKRLGQLAKDKKKEEKDLRKSDEDDIKEHQKRVQNIIQDGAKAVLDISTKLFDNRAMQRANEMEAIRRWEQEQLDVVGDNEDAKRAIKRKAQLKERAIRVKQAKDDKAEALFQIAIATAVNIVKALTPWGKALAAASGLAQAIIVRQKPLPQFEKGTKNSPEGLAIVGEAGRELIFDGKTGRARISEGSASVDYLTRGSVVVPHKETERILTNNIIDHNSKANEYLSKVKVVKSSSAEIDYDRLGDKFDRSVSKIPINITKFDKGGVTEYIINRTSVTRRLNKRY